MTHDPIYVYILIILSWIPVMLFLVHQKYFKVYLGISSTLAVSAFAYALFGFITLT